MFLDHAGGNPAGQTCLLRCHPAFDAELPVLARPVHLHHVGPLQTFLRGLIRLRFKLPPVQALVSRVFGGVVILGKPAVPTGCKMLLSCLIPCTKTEEAIPAPAVIMRAVIHDDVLEMK